MLSQLAATDVLEALEGVCYAVDGDGHIQAVGKAAWDEFVRDNGAENLASEQIIGLSVFGIINGDTVRAFYKQAVKNLLQRKVPRVIFDYRCDAPAIRRDMRMSISPLRKGGSIMGALFQSRTLAESDRPAMSLFAHSTPDTRRPAEKIQQSAIVTVCSICHSVAADDVSDPKIRTWISPEDFYRLGGSSDVNVSHAICYPCFKKLAPAVGLENGDQYFS